MNTKGLIITVISIFILGSIYFVFSNSEKEEISKSDDVTNQNTERIRIESSDGPELVERKPIEETKTSFSYSGNILGGDVVPFIEYNDQDYQKALDEGKVIYLEFYANWCPTCRAQEPDLIKGISQLDSENVIAFRVNFKDNDTDESEKALEEKHNVTYQHTKVILVDGEEIYNQSEIWDQNDISENLGKY